MADDNNMQWAEDHPAFQVDAFAQGDPGTEFRMRNAPDMNIEDPEQRENITQRHHGKVYVSCECKYIVHGRARDGKGAYLSLIVIEFCCYPNGQRRIKEAGVALRFAPVEGLGSTKDPKVVAIAPEKNVFVGPTTGKQTRTAGGGAEIAPTLAGVAPVTLTAHLEQTTESQTWDAASVSGAMETVDRNWGDKNKAAWQLVENPSATPKFGIPTNLMAAVLVERREIYDEDGQSDLASTPFRAAVPIKLHADSVTGIETFFSRRFSKSFREQEVDDFVYFNPKLPPVGDLNAVGLDPNNLAGFPLERLAKITYRTVLIDAVRTEVQGGGRA